MVDILKNIMNIAYRVRDMQIAGTLSMVLFGAVLVFGIMNCVLGYRLLRFWMMIFGFLIGAGIGLFAIHRGKGVLCSGNDRGRTGTCHSFLCSV